MARTELLLLNIPRLMDLRLSVRPSVIPWSTIVILDSFSIFTRAFCSCAAMFLCDSLLKTTLQVSTLHVVDWLIDWLFDWLLRLIACLHWLGAFWPSRSVILQLLLGQRVTNRFEFWIFFYRESVRVERWAIWRYGSHWKWHGVAVATTCFLSRRFWAHFSSLEQEPRPVCIRLPQPHNGRLLLRTGSFWTAESDLACHTQRRIPPVVCGAARVGKRRQYVLWRSQSTWIVQDGERRRRRTISLHIPKVDFRLGWRWPTRDDGDLASFCAKNLTKIWPVDLLISPMTTNGTAQSFYAAVGFFSGTEW